MNGYIVFPRKLRFILPRQSSCISIVTGAEHKLSLSLYFGLHVMGSNFYINGLHKNGFYLHIPKYNQKIIKQREKAFSLKNEECNIKLSLKY